MRRAKPATGLGMLRRPGCAFVFGYRVPSWIPAVMADVERL
jgi:hypothetical protein